MRKRTAAALLAAVAAALAYRPTRELIGDTMIDAGIRLAHGEPPPMRPEAERRGIERVMAEIRNGKAKEVGVRRNGDSPI